MSLKRVKSLINYALGEEANGMPKVGAMTRAGAMHVVATMQLEAADASDYTRNDSPYKHQDQESDAGLYLDARGAYEIAVGRMLSDDDVEWRDAGKGVTERLYFGRKLYAAATLDCAECPASWWSDSSGGEVYSDDVDTNTLEQAQAAAEAWARENSP